MLQGLEQVGSLFVFMQGLLMIPAMVRLHVDRKVQGMSIWTMAFYCFVSLYYAPVSYLAGLYWTMWGVLFVGIMELVWVVWAVYITYTRS